VSGWAIRSRASASGSERVAVPIRRRRGFFENRTDAGCASESCGGTFRKNHPLAEHQHYPLTRRYRAALFREWRGLTCGWVRSLLLTRCLRLYCPLPKGERLSFTVKVHDWERAECASIMGEGVNAIFKLVGLSLHCVEFADVGSLLDCRRRISVSNACAICCAPSSAAW